MNKEIVLTDITKMHGGMCCVAGMCLSEGGRLYRLSSPGVALDNVMSQGWKVGTVLSGMFCRNAAVGSAHVEDAHWNGYRMERRCGDATLEAFYAGSTVSSLAKDLGIVGKGTPVKAFSSCGRSIATVRPTAISLEIRAPYCIGGKESLRVHLQGAGMTLNYLPVTDQRFFNQDGSIDRSAVDAAQVHLAAAKLGAERLYVRIGITRPFDPKGMGDLQYWAQIDGLHFFDVASGAYARDFTITSRAGLGCRAMLRVA